MTFDANTSITIPVTLEVVDDFISEGTEVFTVKLGSPSGPEASRVIIGLNQSTVFIEDNDGKSILKT